MENATRALLIAGGVLIAIIILAMGVYLYAQFSGQSKTYRDIVSNTEIQKFNSKFEAYIGRQDITSQEVATVYNLAKEYNNVSVTVKENSIQTINISNIEKFVSDNLDSIFSCSNPQYNNEGKITNLVFIKEGS